MTEFSRLEEVMDTRCGLGIATVLPGRRQPADTVSFAWSPLGFR
jgi:hypothetical protein